jgi:hypothetical protein
MSDVAASPITTSAWGLAFSARSFAVTILVESRTQRMVTSGFASSKAAL